VLNAGFMTIDKEKFFAQYFGQNIIYSPNFKNQQFCITSKTIRWVNDGYFIKLKDISKITDEDAEHIIQLDVLLSDNFFNDLKKGYCNKYEVVDYLRSKGYALPFMGYSVDELVNLGWVQLV
jgi:hypothetical protein